MINRHRKGANFERKLVNEARRKGKIAFRSAHNRSPIHVAIIDPSKRKISFIQAKSGKISQNAVRLLKKRFKSYNGNYSVKFKVEVK